MNKITAISPAKVNLFLAITGQREDGFHNLLSVVAPLAFGDELSTELLADSPKDELICHGDMEFTHGDDNTILRTVNLFRTHVKVKGRFRFDLYKKIPVGAGLGGGSSNAVTALESMNSLTGNTLSLEEMHEILKEIGSDCPLFLYKSPVVMRGRGTDVELLDPEIARPLISGFRLIIFKPEFSISTAQAYGQMREAGDLYISQKDAEGRLKSFCDKIKAGGIDHYNNLENVVFKKYLTLPVLLDRIKKDFGFNCMMSGSGSACAVFVPRGCPEGVVTEAIRECMGGGVWIEQIEFMNN